MVGVSGEVLEKPTRHKDIIAGMDCSWDSWPGITGIHFRLYNKRNNTMAFMLKEYSSQKGMYKTGIFDDQDIIRDYGDKFDKWIKYINSLKRITILRKFEWEKL